MTLRLGAFQDAFIDALSQRPAPALAALTEQPAFAVYRNTVMSGCVDALCDNFPAVQSLVGEAWMRSVAAAYAEQCPPTDGRLAVYGMTLPDFLEAHADTHGLAYLADVARLDALWTAAFTAPLEPCLSLAELAGMSVEQLTGITLRPRASVRWQWFARHPVYSLWQSSRQGLAWSSAQPWVAEGVLLCGTADGVSHQPLDPAGCAFMDACAAGATFAVAQAAAAQVQPDLDFGALLAPLLQASVFAPLTLTSP